MSDEKKAGLVEGIAAVVETGMRAVLQNIDPGLERKALESGIEKLQGLVDGTETPLDDAVIEPVVDRLRASFGLPA